MVLPPGMEGFCSFSNHPIFRVKDWQVGSWWFCELYQWIVNNLEGTQIGTPLVHPGPAHPRSQNTQLIEHLGMIRHHCRHRKQLRRHTGSCWGCPIWCLKSIGAGAKSREAFGKVQILRLRRWDGRWWWNPHLHRRTPRGWMRGRDGRDRRRLVPWSRGREGSRTRQPVVPIQL